MRAIVLAAGEGTRLRPHTLDRPKCLVPLAGRPLLGWHTDALRAAGIEDVTIVTGYRSELVDALGYPTLRNPRYDATNMVASLMCARNLLDGRDDVIVSYGDLVFEARIAQALADATRSPGAPLAVTVDRQWKRLWDLRMADPLTDAETLRIATDGNLIELGRKPSSLSEIEAQYMGLIGVSAHVAPEIVAFYDALRPEGPYDGRDRDNMFMTSFLQRIIDDLMPVRAVPVDGGWLEVDTTGDLDTYEALHTSGDLAEYCRLGA